MLCVAPHSGTRSATCPTRSVKSLMSWWLQRTAAGAAGEAATAALATHAWLARPAGAGVAVTTVASVAGVGIVRALSLRGSS